MGFTESKKKDEASAATLKPAEPPSDRSCLKFFAAELQKATTTLSDLEGSLNRLAKIITEGDEAQARMLTAISADGGVALAESNDDATEIGRLVIAADFAAKKAVAARAAAPGVQAQIAAVRTEVEQLEQKRDTAVLTYLHSRANDAARSYAKIFGTLCRQHDALVGISAALMSRDAGGEIVMITKAIEVPRFNLPALAEGGEYLATMRHIASQDSVEEASGLWFAARNRLTHDPDAEIDDLIGPAVDKETAP